MWAAIYSENCFSQFAAQRHVLKNVCSTVSSLACASINIHIAQKFFPPSKRLERTKWMPNPALFKKHFSSHPERLMNVHFAFVVLLRALVKAKPVLYDFEYVNAVEPKNLEPDEAVSAQLPSQSKERTSMLMRRLLDSDILDSCPDVFSAFTSPCCFRRATRRQHQWH